VRVAGGNNAVEHSLIADSNGVFTVEGLVPGAYRVSVNAIGIEPYIPTEVILRAGEKRELPIVATQIPTKTTTVEVAATLNDVAQAQVQQQEQQRVLGLWPNFYSSYIWNAAPMTPKLKFQLTIRSVIDPMTFMVAGSLAGVEQAHNTFPGYGQGSEGYAKRFGAAYADATLGRMVSRAILPTVLHQDPRYFYRGSGSFRSRLLYALAQSVVCRGDNGQLQPNYSQIMGSFAVAGLANLYRAPEDRHSVLTVRHGLVVLGNGALDNLLREFLSRKLTPNVPEFANGKP
jgi:hypothetical protein